jgi:hypothetical protein
MREVILIEGMHFRRWTGYDILELTNIKGSKGYLARGHGYLT